MTRSVAGESDAFRYNAAVNKVAAAPGIDTKARAVIGRAGLTYLVVGMAALIGAGMLSARVLDDFLHPALAGGVSAAGVATLSSGPLQLTPGLRAAAVVTWQSRPGASATGCCVIEFRAIDERGTDLARSRVTVGIADSAGESVVVALPKWQPPTTGRVTVEVGVVDAEGRPAVAASLALAVRHGMKDHTVVIILATFMGVCGAIALTVGAVRAAMRAPRPVGMPADVPRIRRAAMLCHLSGLTGFVLPFGNLVAPFAMWLARRDLDPAVERAGREALNFQLSILVYLLLAFALTLAFIGIVILPLLIGMQFGLTLVAARRAAAGVDYRYPLTFRMV